ncbi:acyltransferase family protein [Flavobacterium aurantiibacter]|uniref:Acyltransferase 3 domain-containing protein n=1 Tax=Flavobacterium aurantiibacter TaxID=2023067 RepID=A0A255ZF94_9FLAO|nr:acyltransferase [Flavobacterium aurantiibacter]OYQ39555.1 hypothetical protein CHX27_14245 [Flavobacterium aurantiibacter]
MDKFEQLDRKYFHTFDALRFLSFFLVFLQHVPVPDFSVFSFFTKSGKIGVSFFFVLSGFLITYILLHEKSSVRRISLKNFFVRRILRIWPLFYAVLLFAFLTPYFLDILQLSFPKDGYNPNWFISALFLENYMMMTTNGFPNVSPLRVMWSLCVEEHFYVLWGIIIAILPIKKVPQLIFCAILFANLSRYIYHHMGVEWLDLPTNLDYFAYGAIPAYILLFKPELLIRVQKMHNLTKYILALTAIMLVFIIPNLNSYWLNALAPTVLGITFSALILFTLPEKNGIRISNNLYVSKLGIYTYSLYLTHTVVINFFLKFEFSTSEFNFIITAVVSLITTILVSILSYHCFEKHFLKLKKYFY